MKKLLLIIAVLAPAITVAAQKNAKMEPWQDPNVFEENRLPMRATFVTDQQQTLALNGVWKFNWNETIEGRLRGFEAPDYDDASWGTMPVPGMWELNGYGDPLYLNIGYAWRGHYENNPPYPPLERNYVGQYRRTFSLDGSWTGKQVCLCIGSATSNVRVWVNGKMVGYSEDSKLEARFDITKYVKAGKNTIALEVFRWCDGSYLEDQDFWRYTGIARGVYVYTREKERLEDIHVVAGMDGSFSVAAEVTSGIRKLGLRILDAEGREVATGEAVPSKNKAAYSGTVEGPALWSAETPNLYTLEVSAYGKKGLAESASLDFGFRTVEVKGINLLVNGKPVLIKGADRHEISSTGGYVLSEAEMVRDIRIMKELNMNAVRTCHYPDDPLWYALCDRYGLYVVDEGNIESHGMGYEEKTLAVREDFKAAHLARDSRMVMRDFNHPCVIVWSLGNEAGDGPNFVACYEWIKAYDPSRPVQYERAEKNAHTDIICPMYRTPDFCEEYCLSNPDRPLIQCEYAHAMGNSMGNFKEYWDIIRKYPAYQGGFIWDFVDQAVRWPSKAEGNDHIYAFGGDFNGYDPSDGSFNCNGVIAADRSLHPHAYEVRYQYRNILTTPVDVRAGRISIYNENFFKDLSQYRLLWTVSADGEAVASGVVEDLDVAPQAARTVKLDIPAIEAPGKDILLDVSYVLKVADGLLPAGFEVAYDQFMVQEGNQRTFLPGSAAVTGCGLEYSETGSSHIFSGSFYYHGTGSGRAADWKAAFDKATGFLAGYSVNGVEMLSEPLTPEFSRAPVENDMGARLFRDDRMGVWRYVEPVLKNLEVSREGEGYRLVAEYSPLAKGAAGLRLSYLIHADGSIEGQERMTDAGGLDKAPDMFRFGMKFTMPGSYSTVDFYGLGPWENYCDRNSSAKVGHYVQDVADQYHYGYVRTQESGTHTGLKYIRLLNPAGNGLEISSVDKFSASAIPFSIRELDCMENGTPVRENKTNVQVGEPRHSLDQRPLAHEGDRSAGKTCVIFEQAQMGVGGIHSWGELPLEKYRLHAGERDFRYIIHPICN